jgi:hypothetical protein
MLLNQDDLTATWAFNFISLLNETTSIISQITPEKVFLTKKSLSQWNNISAH